MWKERCDGLQKGCKGREERSSLIRRTGKLTQSGLTWSQSLVTRQVENAAELLQIHLLFLILLQFLMLRYTDFHRKSRTLNNSCLKRELEYLKLDDKGRKSANGSLDGGWAQGPGLKVKGGGPCAQRNFTRRQDFSCLR
jgi:hypothetical protein